MGSWWRRVGDWLSRRTVATLDTQIIKDSLWIRISFPVAGWVNAHYICELE